MGRRGQRAPWRNVMLMRGSAWRTFGTLCSQSCWQAPPITNRSPRPRSNDCARATAARPHPQRARRADADDGDDRVVDVLPVAVAVPRHRVVAVAVAVEPDRVERLGVADAEHAAHRRPAPASPRGPARTSTTPSGAARAAGAPTSSPSAGAIEQLVDEVVEHPLLAGQPARAGDRATTCRRGRCGAGRRTTRRPPARRPSRTARPGGNRRSRTCVRCSRRRARSVKGGQTRRRGGGDRRPRRRPPRRLPRAHRPGGPPPARARPSCSSPRASRRSRRLLASGHRVRSVLVTPQARARLGAALDDLDAPGLRRPEGACWRRPSGSTSTVAPIAAADRRPLPALVDVVAGARSLAVLEGLNDPENLGAIARSARALGIDGLVLDPQLHRPVLPPHDPGQHGRGAVPPRRPGDRVARRPRRAARRRVRDLGADARTRAPSRCGRCPCRRASPCCSAPRDPGLSAAAMAAATRRVRIPIDPTASTR